MTTEQYKHYIEQYKKHEENHTSTNDRMAYWKNYFEQENDSANITE